jgi:hypothetical protein
MTPDQLFSLANALALLAWLCLLFLPHVAAIRNVIAAAVIPCLFATAYAVILARFFDPGGFARFSTLEGLASLQTSPWLLLAGWLHYLAFDLFVGAWEVRTARRDGIAHVAIVPSLFLTFMVGPAGLLAFTLTRLLLRKQSTRPAT